MGNAAQDAAAQRRYIQTPNGRAARAAKQARYRAANRDKSASRTAVWRAVSNGVLVKEPCHCGEAAVEAHHPNGYAPEHRLDVEWLCRPHHKEAHFG